MSTHGTILVKGDMQDWWLHAYSDGHHDEAIGFLMRLPWKINQAGREQRYGFWQHRSHVTGPVRPWKNKEDFIDTYIRHIPFRTWEGSIANWIVWARFNHWHIIERKNLPYLPDPDITVKVTDWKSRLYTYTIEDHAEWDDDEEDQKYKAELESDTRELAELLNVDIQDAGARVTCETGLIEVPIDRILIDLMWGDYQKIESGWSLEDLVEYGEPRLDRNDKSEEQIIADHLEGP